MSVHAWKRAEKQCTRVHWITSQKAVKLSCKLYCVIRNRTSSKTWQNSRIYDIRQRLKFLWSEAMWSSKFFRGSHYLSLHDRREPLLRITANNNNNNNTWLNELILRSHSRLVSSWIQVTFFDQLSWHKESTISVLRDSALNALKPIIY